MSINKTLAVASIIVASMIVLAANWTLNRFRPESTPVARGEAYAGTRGCVSCHGNPEYLRPDSNAKLCSNHNIHAWHPDYDVNCADVMAYFASVRLQRNFQKRVEDGNENALIAGERLARTYHCFQCHGQMGQGGFRNARSLKGYIPGYFGEDFRYLTDQGNPESVRNWIAHGTDPRLEEHPLTGWIATVFLRRQAIDMPKFESLQSYEIDALVQYVIAINAFGPMTVDTIRHYEYLSRTNHGENL